MRAPISLFRDAKTNCVGPEILKYGEPDPTDSTPGKPEVKLTEVAFEYPQMRRVSTPITPSLGRKTVWARGSVETVEGTARCMN